MHLKFIAAMSTIAKLWKEPRCPSTDEWIKKRWCIYIHWNTMQPSKNQNLAICNNVDGTRGYYVKRNKSIRERQLSYDLSDMRNLRGRVRVHVGTGGKNETRWDQGGRKTIRDS